MEGHSTLAKLNGLGMFINQQDQYKKAVKASGLPSLSASQAVFLDAWLNTANPSKPHFPSRSDFPPNKYAAHLLDVVVFDVEEDPADFKYRLFGSTVRYHSHEDFTGRLLSTLPGKGPGSVIWKMLSDVVANKAPFYREVPYVGPHKDYKRSSVLFLPLASDRVTINKVFLVAQFIPLA